MLSSESRSRSVTSAPMRSPSSWMACTLTPTRLRPSLVSNSVSAATSLSSSLSMRSAPHRGCPAGKISVTRRPKKCPAGAPRNFSAAGLIMTARASRVNRSKPSSRPAMTEFMFSRMVLKISCTPRNCCPTCEIFRLTCPSSSPLPANSLAFAEGTSYCPAEMRSSCAAMSRSGASVAPLTTAASRVEITRATSTMVPEVRKLGPMSLNRNLEESTTRTSPNG